MSLHIWTFSPSSKDAVDRCIAAARPPDESNKWIQRFGLQNCIQTEINSIEIDDEKSVLNTIPVVEDSYQRNEDFNIEYYLEICESIEEDPITKFETLVENCLKDHKILTHLANKLSNSCIEKIINHIYQNDHINKGFIEKFHVYFVPSLIKKEHNWLTQDILIKSHRIYPNAFKTLLEMIINDLDIKNNILEDLIQYYNERELSEIINIITDIQLSTEQFLHNIYTIYTAYKGCKKSVEIQNAILTHIIQNAQNCISDKNYGRLLLNFLQNEKELSTIKDYKNIEKAVDMHRSPFGRPCKNLLKELLDKHNASMDSTTVNTETM